MLSDDDWGLLWANGSLLSMVIYGFKQAAIGNEVSFIVPTYYFCWWDEVECIASGVNWDSWGSLVPVLRWRLINGSVVFQRQCLKWWNRLASALFVKKRPEVLPILEFFWWCTVSGWLLARNTCFSAEAGCSQHPGSLRQRTFNHVSWRSIGMTGMDDYLRRYMG